MGKVHTIEVYGIEQISSPIEPVNSTEIAKLLSVPENKIARPKGGEIDILVGMQYASLHPVRKRSVGNLLLMENQFGHVVAGSHPLIQDSASVTSACMQVRTAIVMHANKAPDTFFEIEGLGVMCEPRCGGCRCGSCHLGGKNMSLKEEKEYQLIEQGLSFNENTGRWIAKYPWIKSPEELPDNRFVVLAILKSLERRLARDTQLASQYNQQIHEMEKRNAARRVSDDELAQYDGPKFYISHHAVLKPSSKSTPCRIVFNSSARHLGHSLNDYLAKGPSLLNQLLSVLLRFREKRFAFIGDISKMFHSIDIPLRDQMTHLYLWRNLNTEEEPKTYAMTAVNMGDRPSSTIAQVALRKTAEIAADKHPEASTVIIRNTYMDDILNSVDTQTESTGLRTEIDTILASKGFTIKEWVCSGRDNTTHSPEAFKDLTNIDEFEREESVLGVKWKPDADILKFLVKTPTTMKNITKRKILSTINKIYDPLGLLAPFTVKLKILMRKIWDSDPKIDWDDPITSKLLDMWNNLVNEIDAIRNISFNRSLTPLELCSEPLLIIFSDGSQQAYGAAAYIRWRTASGFKSNLIIAKTRMAPLKIIDIVKLELCGAVLGKRLRQTIQKEMRIDFVKTMHITDSEIVHAMVKKSSYGFNTYTANRIGEIHQTTSPNDWYWVPGKPTLNVADMTTRGSSPKDMDKDSLWQTGPAFLSLPEEQWPVKQEPNNGIEMPEGTIKKAFVGTIISEPIETLASRFNLDRFSKWKLLLRTTARIMLLYERFNSETDTNQAEPTVKAIEKAEKLWITEAQKKLDVSSLKKLRPVIEDGVIVVGGRTERWMQATWNRQKFILLPKEHPVSRMIAQYEHDVGGHLGVEATIAKIRSKYWILGIRDLVRKLVGICVKCRKKLMKFCSQQMSPLPEERLRPSPPFTHVGVDYFGPYTIKGEVQKRVRGKCYGILFTCLSARAVYIDIARDYSTDGFMEVFRRFACIRGWPQTAYSDNATMLVGASNELKKVISNIDWEKIKSFGADMKMEWSFPPADAPWYNGATEALIKTTKRALNAAIGENVLTFSEFQTVMFEVGQIVNQRPIGRVPSTPDDGSYLCPNDLLLGRSSAVIPQGPFENRSSFKYRLDFTQNIVNAFWVRWSREVFPNLVIQPKWHTKSRNLQKGDVVLVQDSNLVRGQWKLALVQKTHTSKDQLVRKATLSYRTAAGTLQEIERPVQRLILLVPVNEN